LNLLLFGWFIGLWIGLVVLAHDGQGLAPTELTVAFHGAQHSSHVGVGVDDRELFLSAHVAEPLLLTEQTHSHTSNPSGVMTFTYDTPFARMM